MTRNIGNYGALLTLFILLLGFVWIKTSHRAPSCHRNLGVVKNALEVFAEEKGHYPSRLDELRELVPSKLKKLPACPTSSSSYERGYTVSPDGQSFSLRCSRERWAKIFGRKSSYFEYVSGKETAIVH